MGYVSVHVWFESRSGKVVRVVTSQAGGRGWTRSGKVVRVVTSQAGGRGWTRSGKVVRVVASQAGGRGWTRSGKVVRVVTSQAGGRGWTRTWGECMYTKQHSPVHPTGNENLTLFRGREGEEMGLIKPTLEKYRFLTSTIKYGQVIPVLPF
ncbi:hypothetical protein V1264_002489 [Littorina saxatilis]|uniref:Uncharacterized protein n=1 Tax=Littorina saxatilis TaxID=31220 RepID=A0AAN9B3R1_9CAEN